MIEEIDDAAKFEWAGNETGSANTATPLAGGVGVRPHDGWIDALVRR
jgi:hypothetical protein